MYLTLPLRWSPSNFVTAVGLEKYWNDTPTRSSKSSFVRSTSTSRTERRTDGRICHNNVVLVHCGRRTHKLCDRQNNRSSREGLQYKILLVAGTQVRER